MEGVAAGAVVSMPGVVEQVMVKEGERVKAGQALVVMIAMKMEASPGARGKDGELGI